MLGIIFAIFVAIIWALGEVSYSKVSKKYDNTNIYMYTYLLRAIIYASVVLIFKRSLIGTFDLKVLSSVLPIIFCDLFATLVINIAVYNGKLSVVSPIMSAYPVLDIFLGVVLLKEKVHPIEILLVISICMAIVFLARNQKKTKKAPNPIKGIIFSICYMLLVAFSIYFEKNIYINKITVYELYYYKAMVYMATSLIFATTIAFTPVKLVKPNMDLMKGCGLTPVGNVLDSFALRYGSMILVVPISSLYSVITMYLSKHVLKERIRKRERFSIFYILFATLLLIVLKIIL